MTGIDKKAPNDLSAEAKGIWECLNADYKLDSQQLVILMVAMVSYDRFNEARKDINRIGITYETRSGYLRSNPALQIEKEACSRFLHSWKMLGLNIAALVGKPTDRRMLNWEKVLSNT